MTPTPALRWTLRSIARIERAGDVRPARLTEPGHTKWHRMRRKLGWADFIGLLHEDLADAFPHPFDLGSWSADPTADLDDATAEALVTEAATAVDADPLLFLRQAAKGLDLPTGGNIADLPKLQPAQKALELPGAGGRIAAWQVRTHGLSFHENFVFVADTDAERILIGLAAVELRANAPTILTTDQALAALEKGRRFDRVFGLDTPAARHIARRTGLEVTWA